MIFSAILACMLNLTCDKVEKNIILREDGSVLMTQLIFYRWVPEGRIYEVIDWQKIHDDESMTKHWSSGQWKWTGKLRSLRNRIATVTTGVYVEKHTRFDLEIEHRNLRGILHRGWGVEPTSTFPWYYFKPY